MTRHEHSIPDERRPAPARSTRAVDEAMIVLVVVPDADMRLYMRGCLRNAPRVGRVIEASDGIEALTLARAGAVDFVITDRALPRLDGPGLHAALQDDPRLRHIPVLVVGDDPPGKDPGDGFLSKPFNTRQLRDAVERLHAESDAPPTARPVLNPRIGA